MRFNIRLFVLCVERNTKNFTVCNDVVREICEMSGFTPLSYIAELIDVTSIEPEEVVSFCDKCGNYIDYDYTGPDPEGYPFFECKCLLY